MGELNITIQANPTPEVCHHASDFPIPLTIAQIPRRPASTIPNALRYAFSFPALLAAALVGGVFTGARVFRVDPDLWWHIKVGNALLATHHLPTTDHYSFTVSGQPWLAYEWLGDLALAAISRIGGLIGLEVLLIMLGSAIVIGLYLLATIRCGNSKAGFIACVLLSLLAGVSFSLRPQMFGYLFLVLALICLERFRQGKPGAIWLLPPLMILWVNTHGSWIVGLIAIFFYWISGIRELRVGNLTASPWTPGQRKGLGISFLLSLAAIFVTPYGPRIAVSPLEYAFSLPLNVKYIDEWQPMAFDLISGKLFLAILLAVILAQITMRLTWRLEEFVLFIAGTAMACLHVRFLMVFVPFAVPVLAVIFSRWLPPYDRTKDKPLLNAALMACAIAAIIYYFPSRSALAGRVENKFPVRAVEYLQDHVVPEPIFNNYDFGGYLVWSRGPQHKVFIDGRGDVYERGGVLADYVRIAGLKPDAFDLLRRYGIQSCLLKRDEALATALSKSPDWRRVYTDNLVGIFVRTRPWN
jgi:hypothetical protein